MMHKRLDESDTDTPSGVGAVFLTHTDKKMQHCSNYLSGQSLLTTLIM